MAAAQSVGLVSSYAASAGSDAETIGEAWTSLVGLLGDPRAEVRAAAANSLGIIATSSVGGSRRGRRPSPKEASPTLDVETAAGILTGLLEDADVAVRLAAIGAMGAIAPKANGEPPRPLFAALEKGSVEDRAAAAMALAGYRNGLDSSIPILLRNVERDGLPVHKAYISALGRIRPPAVSAAVVPVLIAALGSRDRDVRLQVVSMLSRLAPDARPAIPGLIAILNEPTESDRRVPDRSPYPTFTGPAHSAAQALSQIARGTESAGPVMAALVEVVKSGHRQRRGSAATALGDFGPAAVAAIPALTAFLKEAAASEAPTRDGVAAARALGRIAPSTPAASDVVAALTDALRSKTGLTREAAIQALAPFGSKAASAIPLIRELKEKDPETSVRAAAADTLAILGGGSK